MDGVMDELRRVSAALGYHFRYYLFYNSEGYHITYPVRDDYWEYISSMTERVDKLVKMCEGLTERELKDLKEVIDCMILNLEK